AVDGDGALVRLLHAVEDLHQGRLAGAVLAHEGMDGALADTEVDVVVGHDTGESLRDPGEFDGGLTVDRRSGRRAAGRFDGALSWGRGPSTRVAPLRHTKGWRTEPTGCGEPGSPHPVARTQPRSDTLLRVVRRGCQLDLTLMSPLMIFSLAFSMTAWSSASSANFGLEFDRLTSPVFRSPLTIPVAGLPSSTDCARLYTALATSFIAEVRIESLYLARASCLYWSESTPIAHTLLAAAASMTPWPERPAAA